MDGRCETDTSLTRPLAVLISHYSKDDQANFKMLTLPPINFIRPIGDVSISAVRKKKEN